MDVSTILPVILTVCLIILTIVLVVVGVQVVIVLNSIKKTIDRANEAIDITEAKVAGLIAPFQSFGGMASSLGTGLKVFESFVGWLNRSKKE